MIGNKTHHCPSQPLSGFATSPQPLSGFATSPLLGKGSANAGKGSANAGKGSALRAGGGWSGDVKDNTQTHPAEEILGGVWCY